MRSRLLVIGSSLALAGVMCQEVARTVYLHTVVCFGAEANTVIVQTRSTNTDLRAKSVGISCTPDTVHMVGLYMAPMVNGDVILWSARIEGSDDLLLQCATDYAFYDANSHCANDNVNLTMTSTPPHYVPECAVNAVGQPPPRPALSAPPPRAPPNPPTPPPSPPVAATLPAPPQPVPWGRAASASGAERAPCPSKDDDTLGSPAYIVAGITVAVHVGIYMVMHLFKSREMAEPARAVELPRSDTFPALREERVGASREAMGEYGLPFGMCRTPSMGARNILSSCAEIEKLVSMMEDMLRDEAEPALAATPRGAHVAGAEGERDAEEAEDQEQEDDTTGGSKFRVVPPNRFSKMDQHDAVAEMRKLLKQTRENLSHVHRSSLSLTTNPLLGPDAA